MSRKGALASSLSSIAALAVFFFFFSSPPGLIRAKGCTTSIIIIIVHFGGRGAPRSFRNLYEALWVRIPLVHLRGLLRESYCLHSRLCLGAGMVLTSWEFQGTNPGKLARLPALGLVTFGIVLMGCLSPTFVVDFCR